MKTKDLKLVTMEYINLQENLSTDSKITMMEFVKEASREQVLALLFTGQMRNLQEGEARLVNKIYESTILSEFSLGKMFAALASAVDRVIKGTKNLAGVPKVGVVNIHDPRSMSTQALGNSDLLKNLSKKWAMYKVPSAKELPGDLGVTAGSREDLAAFAGHYKTMLKSLNAGVPVAAAVVAAIIFIIGRKAYKAFLTKAARACKGTSGDQKTECIRQFKIKAMQETIKVLQSQKEVCKATSKPSKCAALIDKRINKKQDEIRKMLMTRRPR